MKASQVCKDLIIKYECSGDAFKYLCAYKCPAGYWTIGIGFTTYEDGQYVREGDCITPERCMSLFEHKLEEFESCINKLVIQPTNQNQFDALVSFCFNIGCQNFKVSTLLQKINKNPNDPSIKDEIKRWIYVHGTQSKGLINRREEEAQLYFR
jgi:lysozyme